MKLSEAILMGSTVLRPMPYSRNNSYGSGCAMGMAEVACGIRSCTLEYRYPFLNQYLETPPCGCTPYMNGKISYAIAHVFNKHVCEDKTWTLEQLVDWVRSVEPEEQPTPQDIKEWKEELALVTT